MQSLVSRIIKSPWWNVFVVVYLVAAAAVPLWDYFSLHRLWYFFDIGSDTVNWFFPQLMHNAHMERQGLWHWWSFYLGMGMAFPTYLVLDPTWLVFNHYVFFWPEAWKFSFHILYFGEVLASAVVMYFYFREIGLRQVVSLLGAVLWQLSGYMIVGMAWYVFPYFLLAGSLILLGIEKLIKSRNPVWFIYGVYLLSVNLYFFLTFSVFFAIYLLLRFLESRTSVSQAIRFVVKAVFYGTLGLMANLVNILPSWQRILNSPRVSGDVTMFQRLLHNPEPISGKLRVSTTILRFFGNDLTGTAVNWHGWFNYLEAPLFYVGLISLLLVAVFFVLADRRQRLIYGLFLGLWLVVAFVPILRHAVNLFAGNYFRGTIDFFVSFSLLLVAMKALDLLISREHLPFAVLSGWTLFLIALIFFAYRLSGIEKDRLLTITVIAFLLAEAYFLYLLTTGYKNIALVILVLLGTVEVAYFANYSMKHRWAADKDQFVRDWGGYRDGTLEALKIIRSIEDSPFYRVEKDYSSGKAMHASLNDNMVQNYYSTVSYNSFNQLNYIRFLEAVGVVKKGVESQTRWAHGVRSLPLMMSLAGVKYFLTKNINTPLRYMGFDSISTAGDVMVLKNNYALPLAFTYDRVIDEGRFYGLDNFRRQQALLTAAVVNGQDAAFNTFPILDTADLVGERQFNLGRYKDLIARLNNDSVQVISFSGSDIWLKLTTSAPKVLCFSIPFDTGWQVWDNDKKLETFRIDIGLTGVILPQGDHTIHLRYRTPFYWGSLIISIFLLIIILLIIVYQRKLPFVINKN